MAKKRKSLSPKTRFEVFKRDSFTCQYCGGKAPDVILRADHIHPVAGGGGDDMLNLLTACFTCNSGKGARRLTDTSEVEKQRRMLEELNERRIQLEMMLEWRKELTGLKDMTANALIAHINGLTPGWIVNETGMSSIRKWLKTYRLEELLDAADSSAHGYLKWEEGKVVRDSWGTFFSYIPKIAAVARAEKNEPYLRDLFYVRGILRNNVNFHWRAQRDCMDVLKAAVAAGISTDDLKTLAKRMTSYDRFEEAVESWIEDAKKARG